MVTVDARADRTNGVTTVRVVLTNTHSTPQTVRLEHRLDGPIWPPRPNGVADPRWTGDCWETTIRPDRSEGLGFASPATPTDPLVTVVSSTRSTDDRIRSPETVLAGLDTWCPPSDILERTPNTNPNPTPDP
ncbi:DUF7857 domain-containing protein [Natrialba taiwanensis]|uniref:Uncharacterized protein n=1 Tax=Natrialba taiwanensis DSM 12281 TaxID=1230458 RepID=M0AF15_9EURY|nr:hypothetical protein [Natrialba taiwanensis]ELY96462.1 hypothetical protein C484_02080 [Natrialba taiwanensis DSM 12281]